MRIGMMADVYKPHVSGITNYISLNKKYLEAAGHEVFVFTFGDDDYPDDETNILRSVGFPILDTGYYISLRYKPEARQLLRTMDVAHVHHPFLSGSLALRYCRPRGIPLIFTNHTRYDLYAHAYLPAIPDVVGETALQAYMPSFCRSCDLVIAPSHGMRQVLLKLGVDAPVDVVPNGVDLRPFQNPVEPRNPESFGFSPDDVILVYTGRMGPEKNLSFLLRAFNGALHACDRARLLLIGDGPERDNLQDRARVMGIENQVHFTGMVPYVELPGYLAAAHIFVTASVTEVHPLSVIEAMAAGLPVLGIQSPGVGDTIVDGETGFLADEVDLAAFTGKMVRLLMDRELQQMMGNQAREAAQQYSIERTTKLMLQRYHAVVENSRANHSNFRVRWARFLDQFRS